MGAGWFLTPPAPFWHSTRPDPTSMKYLYHFLFLFCLISNSQAQTFQHSVSEAQKPWTSKPFYNDADNFQFVVVSDRTGGHREGVFGKAMEKINGLYPEFVMSVGDYIEGYTNKPEQIRKEWDELDSIMAPLQSRFFYVPGNHDFMYRYPEMVNTWKERFGTDYYHFTYKNVLFLMMNSNDGDGVTMSQEQIDYMKQAIADNPEVRWTMIFMHHPIWSYVEFSRFDQIEQALAGKNYTVFAGHTHHYLNEVRQDNQYYVLGTTGGGSSLRGPKFGEFDHITWVTLTDEGPKLMNLALSGILPPKVSTPESRELADWLIESAEFKTLVMEQPGTDLRRVVFNIKNVANRTMYFSGRFFHNHQAAPDSSSFQEAIAPGTTRQFSIDVRPQDGRNYASALELDWRLGYADEFMEPEFALTGTRHINLQPSAEGLAYTKQPVFIDELNVNATHNYEGLSVYVDEEGSNPLATGKPLTEPITITSDYRFALALIDEEGYRSQVIEQEYTRVKPRKAKRVKKPETGLVYQYYEVETSKIPDFSRLTPERSAVTEETYSPFFLKKREDYYALNFSGYLDIPETGVYTFYVYSDDGSKMFLHEECVVDNDGVHEGRRRKGSIALTKGMHPVRIAYFDKDGGQRLRISYQGPGMKEPERLPMEWLYH